MCVTTASEWQQLLINIQDEVGVGEGSDKLKPYKTDLEYLDDHFRLIAYKLKAKSMDNRMEHEV